jgi:hypothetical protein
MIIENRLYTNMLILLVISLAIGLAPPVDGFVAPVYSKLFIPVIPAWKQNAFPRVDSRAPKFATMVMSPVS